MQKYKVVNQANADGTAKDGTINDPTSGTKITANFLNDNFFNLFSFVENAGYSLIDDDLSQLTKALKGRYVSTYTYNTNSITTQSVNDVVLGSDGKYYEVQNNNVTNDDPVSSVTGNWVLTSFDASPFGIGFNQTWQDVTSSRSLGVVYTNTTNKPIQINIIARFTGGLGGINLYVSNKLVSKVNSEENSRLNLNAIIPADQEYYLENTNEILFWHELR